MSESVQWQVIVSRKAERALRRLPQDLLQRLRQAIRELGLNPRPVGYKKLVGSDFCRIRVGDWRIVYTIEEEKLIVLVVTVAPRGSVYKDL
jgi:mRNA interferase RelE/StbE